MTTKAQHPIARTQNLELQELSGEVLIYDMDRHKAHCLNPSIATIWRACDGTKDVAALAAVLQEKLKTTVDEEVVWSALEQLAKNHLLQAPVIRVNKQEKVVSRREMARRIGGIALIPAIASLLAPRAAQAASCSQTPKNDTCPCTDPGETNGQCIHTCVPTGGGNGICG
jgi:hypothetical protein